MRSKCAPNFAAAVVTVLAAAALAELPPTAYVKKQADAPEAVEVRVTKVSVEDEKDGRLVSAEAEITGVTRSASGLKAGDKLTIRYRTRPDGAAVIGPSATPVLKQGDTVPAYLARDGKTYKPVAGGMSFHTIDLRPDATEQLTIRINLCIESNGERGRKVVVTAGVEEVKRSDSGLRVGDTLTINYELDELHPTEPVLDQVFTAYLDKAATGSFYQCAAGVQSLEPAPAATQPAGK